MSNSETSEEAAMRKLVMAMMMTVNGRIDQVETWLPGIPDDFFAELDRVFEREFDSILIGRVTAEEMATYWPGAETENLAPGGLPDAPQPSAEAAATNRSMARKMNAYKKYVPTSDPSRKLDWSNLELVPVRSDDDLVRFVAELKAQPGRDIHLPGGAKLVQSASRLGLIDEYHLWVQPVVSVGESWFDKISEKRDLELIGTTTYSGGLVVVKYRVVELRPLAGATPAA